MWICSLRWGNVCPSKFVMIEVQLVCVHLGWLCKMLVWNGQVAKDAAEAIPHVPRSEIKNRLWPRLAHDKMTLMDNLWSFWATELYQEAQDLAVSGLQNVETGPKRHDKTHNPFTVDLTYRGKNRPGVKLWVVITSLSNYESEARTHACYIS